MSVYQEALLDLGIETAKAITIEDDMVWRERSNGISWDEAARRSEDTLRALTWLVISDGDLLVQHSQQILNLWASLVCKGLRAIVAFHNLGHGMKSKIDKDRWLPWLSDFIDVNWQVRTFRLNSSSGEGRRKMNL